MNLWKKLTVRKIKPELAQDLLDKTQREIEKMPPINILVAGKTGSGKSTLINALFRETIAETGVGLPITQSLVKLTKDGVPLTLYDTRGLELDASVQQDVQQLLLDLIHEQRLQEERHHIHLVYYCLNANGSRIEPFEIELIQTLASQVPVVLVLTQAIGQEHHEFAQYLQTLPLNVQAIVPILAKDYALQKRQVVSAFGLQTLIDKTLEIIPSEVHQAFINAQQIDLEKKVESARSWARKYVSSAFGVGFLPIPIADATLLIPMQITMLGHLTAIFGLSLDLSQVISLLAGLGGTGGATLVGRFFVGSLFKLIPGLGGVSGGILTGATASTLTVTLGYSYIEVLRYIAKAEMLGQTVRLKRLQHLMNQSFEAHLSQISNLLPADIKSNLPEWFQEFIQK
ncbi:MAG: 50S ribosome-binding GTPase [Aerococcaceae bacterium]|nr:50S ribosome-binding GTPase [Aerococcaceae bacterium]